MGATNKDGIDFLGDLERRITQNTYDHRESVLFLFQRLSVLIQRYNAVAVFSDSTITNFLQILTVKCLKICQYLTKLRRTKLCPFFRPPCIHTIHTNIYRCNNPHEIRQQIDEVILPLSFAAWSRPRPPLRWRPMWTPEYREAPLASLWRQHTAWRHRRWHSRARTARTPARRTAVEYICIFMNQLTSSQCGKKTAKNDRRQNKVYSWNSVRMVFFYFLIVYYSKKIQTTVLCSCVFIVKRSTNIREW